MKKIQKEGCVPLLQIMLKIFATWILTDLGVSSAWASHVMHLGFEPTGIPLTFK